MPDRLKIYIDRLKEDKTEIFKEEISADLFGLMENDLQFKDPVFLEAKVYLSSEYLIVEVSAKTIARITCSICNNFVNHSVEVINDTHTILLEDIKGKIYYFKDLVRESLLLELPSFIECQTGNCPDRKSFNYFLKGNDQPESTDYFPFSNLDK